MKQATFAVARHTTRAQTPIALLNDCDFGATEGFARDSSGGTLDDHRGNCRIFGADVATNFLASSNGKSAIHLQDGGAHGVANTRNLAGLAH